MKNKNSEIENKNNSKNTDATNTNEINLAIDSTRQKQEKPSWNKRRKNNIKLNIRATRKA